MARYALKINNRGEVWWGVALLGVARQGKVNKQPIRVRYGMAWFGAVMQGRVSTH